MNRRTRLVGACLLAGASALTVLQPAARPVTAQAQVTAQDVGGGLADSAVVVSGREGRFDDFSSLEITVSQTRNLTNQAITVSWIGGAATPRNSQLGQNYLQIMQCWGEPDAPDDTEGLRFRETCLLGAELAAPSPSTNGALSLNSNSRSVIPVPPALPADEAEILPDDAKMVPFRSVNSGTTPDGSSASPFELIREAVPPFFEREPFQHEVLAPFFDRFSTNEVPYALTAADGTGRVNFEVQNAIRGPHLGCGAEFVDRDGVNRPSRPCYLVIVPRGNHDAYTGQEALAGIGGTAVNGSPFAPAIWANRLVVRLEFDPVSGICPLGREERRTAGTELVAEAITSWQPALCADGGPVFGYASTGDAEAARQVLSQSLGAPGVVFTSDPVVTAPADPALIPAPVALSAVVLAFNVDARITTQSPVPPEFDVQRGVAVQEINLTPRLVAKLLTQSYTRDVPTSGGEDPPYLEGNPNTIRDDPEFRELNPIFEHWETQRSASPVGGLMVAVGSSAGARELWRWILSDGEARQWLAGEPDEHGMKVNPNYVSVLSGSPPDLIPKTDPSCVDAPPEHAPLRVCTLDYRPYLGTMNEVAYQTLRADSRSTSTFFPPLQPEGFGRFERTEPQPPGFRWAWGFTESASAARFGMITARLCKPVRNSEGVLQPDDCRAPTDAAVQSAVNALPGSSVPGMRALDSAKAWATPEAYPLSMVTYAVADTSEPQEARRDYAHLLRYAAGPGQQPGTARGQLPEGYVPLPQAMREQTMRAADRLENWVLPSSPSPTDSSTEQPSNLFPGGDETPAGSIPPSGPPAAAAPSGAPSTSPLPSAEPVAQTQTTPGDPLGLIRFVLLTALIFGVGAAIVGALMRHFGVNWPLRPRAGGPRHGA